MFCFEVPAEIQLGGLPSKDTAEGLLLFLFPAVRKQ